MMPQVFEYFGDVEPFLRENDHLAPATRGHLLDLPHWSAVAKKVLLVQPSSAAAERVFSVMEALFNRQQDSALEDTVEASVMLSYNGSQQNVNIKNSSQEL